MKIYRLIQIASDAYGDDLIRQYFDEPGENHGDLLAAFIAAEIKETFEPDETDQDQLDKAARVLENAKAQIESVIEALLRRI